MTTPFRPNYPSDFATGGRLLVSTSGLLTAAGRYSKRTSNGENVVFGAGSFAAIGSDFSLSRIFVGWHFDTSKRHEIGVGGGIHWLHIGAFIEGEILINGTPSSARRTVSEDTPLPNIGVWYDYSISPRWAFRSRFDLLSADVGNYDGVLINVAFGVNYQVFEHVGIGLNYNYFELDVKIDKSG